MRVLLSPIRMDGSIVYSFENDKITATFNGQTDVFDFSAFPDGKAESITTTILKYSPITSAERVNGELSVIVLNVIGEDATEEERFPDWMVV
jgi:hypothetical protein